MLTKMRAGMTGLMMSGVLLTVPVATAATAQAATCAHHTTGVCKANSPHPRGATAQCKDGIYSYAVQFRGTCSTHHGVRYWYK